MAIGKGRKLALVPKQGKIIPKIVMPQGGFQSHEGGFNGFECGCITCHSELWCCYCLVEFTLIQEGKIARSPYFYGGGPCWVGPYHGRGRKDLCPNHNADWLAKAPEPDYTEERWQAPKPQPPHTESQHERTRREAAEARKVLSERTHAYLRLLENQPNKTFMDLFDVIQLSFRKTNGQGGFVDIGPALSEIICGFGEKTLEKERQRPEPVDKSDWNCPDISDSDLPPELFDD